MFPLAALSISGFAARARAQETLASEPGQSPPEPAEPEEPPPKDAWHIRLNAGAAFERTRVRYEVAGATHELNSTGAAVLLQLAIGAKLGRDVFLGVIGGFFYVPRSHVDDEWTDNTVVMVQSNAFIDHRLPFARNVHLGAMIGPGFINAFGPEEEHFSGWGPVGGMFVGYEGPRDGRLRGGIMLEVLGGAMSNAHSISGSRAEFDTVLFAIGLVYTLRWADPRFPRGGFPTLAQGPALGPG